MKMKVSTIALKEKERGILEKAHKILGKKKELNIEIALNELQKDFKEKGEYYMKHAMAINMIQILIESIPMENRDRKKLERLTNLMEKEFDYLYNNASQKVKDEIKQKTREKKDENIENVKTHNELSLF
ncbi:MULTISPECIES: hypothetical protein [Helicobacter]|uniref:Uncharacterized protein n=1 Tax=Helicobacter bilis ATCC 43879 TaxID=613026 RepID=C3XFN4_9HELI|nr:MULTISPECIES: hypothetical protein [Helicobacter]EEO23823.1 hypothetical protein HRAG_00880 [Helicobacter bilis ATCC 43879]